MEGSTEVRTRAANIILIHKSHHKICDYLFYGLIQILSDLEVHVIRVGVHGLTFAHLGGRRMC